MSIHLAGENTDPTLYAATPGGLKSLWLTDSASGTTFEIGHEDMVKLVAYFLYNLEYEYQDCRLELLTRLRGSIFTEGLKPGTKRLEYIPSKA